MYVFYVVFLLVTRMLNDKVGMTSLQKATAFCMRSTLNVERKESTYLGRGLRFGYIQGDLKELDIDNLRISTWENYFSV